MQNGKEIVVKVPASSANLGSGFDTLGLALNIYNYVAIKWSSNPDVRLKITGYGRELNEGNKQNLIYQGVVKVLKEFGYPIKNLSIRLENNIPFCRGLGSSAAAIVGGSMAANALIGQPLDKKQLLKLVFDFEGHPDNIYPAMYGGLIVSSNLVEREHSTHEYLFKKIKLSNKLKFLAVIPEVNVDTKMARQALPEEIKLQDALYNLSRIPLLVMALKEGDYHLLHHAMDDRLHEPYRKKLLPGLANALVELRHMGLPTAISGAGPSVLIALQAQDPKLKIEIENVFFQNGIKCSSKFLEPENQGARILNHSILKSKAT